MLLHHIVTTHNIIDSDIQVCEWQQCPHLYDIYVFTKVRHSDPHAGFVPYRLSSWQWKRKKKKQTSIQQGACKGLVSLIWSTALKPNRFV